MMRFTKVPNHGTCYLSLYAIVDESGNVVSCANDDEEADMMIDEFTKRSEQDPDWKPESVKTGLSYDDAYFFQGEEFST